MYTQPLGVPSDIAPNILPRIIVQFLAESLAMNIEDVLACWEVFKDSIWSLPSDTEQRNHQREAFEVYGHPLSIGKMRCIHCHIYWHSSLIISIPCFVPPIQELHKSILREACADEARRITQCYYFHPWRRCMSFVGCQMLLSRYIFWLGLVALIHLRCSI